MITLNNILKSYIGDEYPITMNAVIEHASIDMNDDSHGFLSSWITLKLCGGGGQMFGGFALDGPAPKESKDRDRIPTECAEIWIMGIMRVMKVGSWNELVGKPCVVLKESDFGKIIAIGNFLEDKWFCPEREFEKFRRQRVLHTRNAVCIKESPSNTNSKRKESHCNEVGRTR